MRIEIDQSGRIEYTRKPTVLAFSNSRTRSIIISASEKQFLQRVFRRANKSRIMMAKTFAVLMYLLVKDSLGQIREIIVDQEYEGHDKQLTQLFCDVVQKSDPLIKIPLVHFRNIGKKSNVHRIAIDAYRKKKADKKVFASDVLKLIL